MFRLLFAVQTKVTNFYLQPVFNMAEYHQLFVGTERLRCPEILFQPSLTGEEQMGLMETLQYVLARLESPTKHDWNC